MIFPFLSGITKFSKAPVTWLLFLINALVVVFTFQLNQRSQESLEKLLKNSYFIDTQGKLYAQYILNHAEHYSSVLNSISKRALHGDEEKLDLLGTMAIRDKNFLDVSGTYKFKGDQIAVQIWRKTLLKIQNIQSLHPSYILGLSSEDLSFQKWFSYIFVHSGGSHFIGNMLFLIIFGCALEPLIGGVAFLIVFLFSGLFAAGSFILMTGATAAPLVGASGAISGIMALFACLYWKKSVRFVYWLFLPFKGYAGYVYLPAWVVLVMWLASDLAGYLGTLSEFGGVAYAAHLGGEATGILVGLIVYFLRYFSVTSSSLLKEENHKMGELHPFTENTFRRLG